MKPTLRNLSAIATETIVVRVDNASYIYSLWRRRGTVPVASGRGGATAPGTVPRPLPYIQLKPALSLFKSAQSLSRSNADHGMEAGAATIRDCVRRQNAVTVNHQQAI